MSSPSPTPPTAASPVLFDRALLRQRRERVAGAAERHAFLLERSAEDICDRLSIVQRRFERVAVVGAHHGLLGRRLRGLANIGLVVELEATPALLVQCDGPRVLADEELLPLRDGALDLVVSALALQFVNDLPGTLAQIRRALKPDGLLMASLIGGRTLVELREALLSAEAEIEGGGSPRVAPFADVRDAGALLQRAGFALPVADSDVAQVSYATPFDLMRELRGMAATNVLLARRRAPLRRATLMRAAEIYAERFSAADGRCLATFEIITMTGWVPHESQQKPLRPGTATARLADVLGPAGSKGDGSVRG